MANAWTVVKVGGSLYDWPHLRERLNAWLQQLDAPHVLLFPGGGPAADVIRAYDQAHHLGEEASHWLAVHALSINARFLQSTMPAAELVARVPQLSDAPRICVLDPLPFFQEDEQQPDHLPHSWNVTSDSLAVRVAALCDARELVLLKSIGYDDGDWSKASRLAVVDGFFSEATRQLSKDSHVRVVNLRLYE